MIAFRLERDLARLAVLQRIELIGPNLKKTRKLFGRYIFTKFISKHFINPINISNSYFKLMKDELNLIKKFLFTKQNILSIGSGIGGLEALILDDYKDSHISFIEKDYVSNKIQYGWDDLNEEGYNSLNLLEKFLLTNGIPKKSFSLFNFNKNSFPTKKFDLVISLYSLDYHYNFTVYKEYFKKIFDENTIIIFDTIRPNYFEDIFQEVEIIKTNKKTVHKSERIVCRKIKKEKL